jgi:predicted MFS family arabinose efflux permease
VTGSLMVLVYALTRANQIGWGTAETIGLLVASAVLMVAFLVVESRASHPLVPLRFFRKRTPTGANIIGFGLGAITFGMFFLLSLYQQEVLGLSALQTGVGYLAVALTAIAASGASQALVTRIGVKPVLAIGMGLLIGGLVYFAQISAHGSYFGDLFLGFLLIGVGLGFSFVPVSIAALSGIEPREAGLASGLINTSQQIGGALGVAILTTVATTRAGNLIASGTPRAVAYTSGYSLAFWVAAGFGAASLAATGFLLRRQELQAEPALELDG